MNINNLGLATTTFMDYNKLVGDLSRFCCRTISIPEIKKVIFQKLHTIVLWADGSKTIVKCSNEDFDKEKGLAMAIARKYMERNEFKRIIENADIQDV